MDKENMIYACTNMYEYAAINDNKIMLFPGKWMEFEIIMSSEMNKAQKIKCHSFSVILQTRELKNKLNNSNLTGHL